MATLAPRFERQFFRALNSVVEPLVRSGILSSRLAPGTLVVLESTGYLSGEPRRTPLLATRIGHRYCLLSTFRGARSFWIRNLEAQPQATLFIGGRQKAATCRALVAARATRPPDDLPAVLARLMAALGGLTRRGWAFALVELSAPH